MSRFELTDEIQAIVAGPFQLAFEWDGDRWRHTVAIQGRIIALSQESDPERDDPLRIVSPTYQQCHTQEVPNARQGLLVGLWGPHHCSGVFHVEESSEGEVSTDVDVAVRSRTSLLGFAATYRIRLTSQALISANGDEIVWRLTEPVGGDLTLKGGPGTRIVLAEAGRQETVVQVDVPVQPSTPTQRLTYAWRWRPSR